MAYSLICLAIQRCAIPFILVLSAFFRPVGISFVYLLMFFVSPFIPVATATNFKGPVTAYLIILITLSSILAVCHGGLQAVLLLLGNNEIFENCSFTDRLLRHIGFVSFKNLNLVAIFEWLAPEIVMLVGSVIAYWVIKKLTITSNEGQLENGETENILHHTRNHAGPSFKKLIKISPLICLCLLFFAAILRPSAPGSLYFIIFLYSSSYTASYKKLKRGFALLLRLVMVMMTLQILCIISYQTPWIQEQLDKENLIARLIGLEPLIISNCSSDIRVLIYNTDYKIDSFLNPIIILLAYYVFALTSKCLLNPKSTEIILTNIENQHLENGSKHLSQQITLLAETHVSAHSQQLSSWTKPQHSNVPKIRDERLMASQPTETTPLVRQNIRRNSKALTASPKHEGDIPMNTIKSGDETDGNIKSSLFDQICYGFTSVGGFIYDNSYIFTNIIMMAWSIVYHSWLTFVFLLWGNVLWMVENQRHAMMRSTPFIVIYAELLLIAQYIYGMNLTNEELPTKVDITGINLQQIGLSRPQEHGIQPCVPLIVKTAFLLMFWITLRQFFKEKLTTSRKHYANSIFSTLRMRMDTTTDSEMQEHKKTSKILKKIGSVIKNLLVRLWIWLVILVILLCALTGRHMTGFRICYMALFLFFLLVFQSSSKIWVKMMYGFWIFLIFYAMTILISIYIYQFDQFDEYLAKYFNIPKNIQQDVGLERFQTKDLFLHLVSPTIIVILTAIQVHYFHKRFIASLIKYPKENETPQSRSRYDRSSRESIHLGVRNSVTNLLILTQKKLIVKLKHAFITVKHFIWKVLEFHFIKVVYISAFVCCINEICVLHLPFLFLCVIGVMMNNRIKNINSYVIAFIATIIILSKMIYQVAYLDHGVYNVSCPHVNETQNSAVWFGFKKANSKDGGLIGILRYYIVFMVITTIHAVVRLRQSQMRSRFGEEIRQSLMFPGVGRESAETTISGLIKYLCNYGYYKFGFEICLIWQISTITFRNDIMSAFYSIWLIIFICLSRKMCAIVWRLFQTFIAIAIILQYFILMGFPPTLCLIYPWEGTPFSIPLQGWSLLPGNVHFDHSRKLMFDFILLLLVNRQTKAFGVEKLYRNSNEEYNGGSNKCVVDDIRNLGKKPFENPTKDFLSNVTNYLDILKNIVLCGLFWVTLAVIFLAGTHIRDILGLGYLISAIIFLWIGSDLYLKPIDVILRCWNLMLSYNVACIVLKTFMQLAGCLFLQQFTRNCCWLVHLLGISCSVQQQVAINETNVEDYIFNSSECPPIKVNIVLVWDAIVFALLIFQLRIFKSHYFCHIILDARANSLLASRGAVLIEELRQKQIIYLQEHENEVLLKIKQKMESIRATQQKMLRPLDKPTHFDEFGYPVAGKIPKRKQVKLHAQAVRSGDYYMFEEVDKKFKLDIIDDTVDYLDDQEKIMETDKKMTRRKTIIDQQISLSKKEAAKDTGDKPSTSKEGASPKQETEGEKEEDVDGEEISLDDEVMANPIVRLCERFLVTMTIFLNRFSRNYRYVNKVLSNEKKELRRQTHIMGRLGHSGAAAVFSMRHLDNSIGESLHENTENSTTQQSTNNVDQQTNYPNDTQTVGNSKDTQSSKTIEHPKTSFDTVDRLNKISSETSLTKADKGLPEIQLSVPSIPRSRFNSENFSKQWSFERPDSSSDLQFEEEEFTAREHNIFIEVFISLFYVLLSNTEVICYIVVFIYQINNASLLSLPLPLMVFLWGTLSLPRPTKTFWVTIIACTQAVVVIKCIFQFKLIWSNYINLPNQPLTGFKIFGLELNSNYAIVDTFLLIALFFHRFMLKSQGLWKSKYRDALIIGGEFEELEHASKVVMIEAFQHWRSYTESRQKMSIDTIESNDDSEISFKENIKALGRNVYLAALSKFFKNLKSKTRMPADVYAMMFLCDFINFLILLFNFSEFASQQVGGESGGVQTYLAENKVPVPFLIMLLAQFLLIVIDRALYLRKALVPKIVFHFFSVIFIHVWMFFIVPKVTERSFYTLKAPIIFYIIKCLYLLLSSYQIKCGYPKRVLGNFLTKGFALPNMIAFKVYTVIPFLYELRSILDWVCIDTTMTLFDWLKMEDIFSDVYFIKCTRQMEYDFPAMRSEKKALFTKLLLGGGFILAIVAAIWGPLCLFALTGAVGQSNVPIEVGISVRIGTYEPIFNTINRENIYVFNNEMFETMKSAYTTNRSALTFLSGYDAQDIAACKLSNNSPSFWNISPPDKERLLNDLKNGTRLTARFSYSLTRVKPDKNASGWIRGEVTKEITASPALIAMLEGENNTEDVLIPDFVPKFLKVLNRGEVSVVSALMPIESKYRPLTIKMHTDNNVSWWEVNDFCKDTFSTETLSKLPFNNTCSGIVLYTFNDKKFPSTFSFLTGGGIIGLYTTLVIVFSRFLKSFITGKNHRIMFDDLPYVDRILQLCLDIYLVREALEFALEEDLFAKLIFLYRSPETMIKWTRPQEELVEEDNESELERSRTN